ncbi:trypsin delta-like [Toxorhynchites rutilus septentrionalis]|uniref:trypsin delta-like n=1 Tax=Toxorhynchites rutilus septentrionalis TaxID=329112 RepID=UPI002478771B|nr:trypsin delta-like [Toxorhynchites rutilus septentrionalis]
MNSNCNFIRIFWITTFALWITAEREKLTIDEARIRINRIPSVMQNVIAYATNEVHLKMISTNNSNNRIINGTGTTIEQHPHQIGLLYKGSHICGGSIISDKWVLTAAHCLDWYPLHSEISVRSGSTYHANGGTVHPVFYYHIHEKYLPTDYSYDVATVRVKTPFKDSARVSIPLATSEWLDGANVTVTGWGQNEHNSYPDQLYMVTLPVVNRETCNATWSGLITDDMLCAGDRDIDSCDGDSGGPAVQDGVQYGIVSWGGTTCGSDKPGVYTNIAHSSITNFIKRTTRI